MASKEVNTTLEILKSEAKQKASEIAKLEAEIAHLEAMDPVRLFAIELHRLTCGSNHTDGCSWFYEVSSNNHNWNSHAHARYLEKAKKLYGFLIEKNITVEDALMILASAKEY